MNFNNFTIKSQEAIQKAIEITRGAGNQAIEPVHLLKGVMTEGNHSSTLFSPRWSECCHPDASG